MSELLDKQVYVLNECFKLNSGIHAGGHASPRKVCDENERKKERKKEKENDGRVKIFLLEGGLYKAVSEDWLVRFR